MSFILGNHCSIVAQSQESDIIRSCVLHREFHILVHQVYVHTIWYHVSNWVASLRHCILLCLWLIYSLKSQMIAHPFFSYFVNTWNQISLWELDKYTLLIRHHRQRQIKDWKQTPKNLNPSWGVYMINQREKARQWKGEKPLATTC